MTLADHERYAREILQSLPSDRSAEEGLRFSSDPRKSRNAAKAMTTILCHRLSQNSGKRPVPRRYQHLEWNGGVFNCRNIADRDYMWTNLRPRVADDLHQSAQSQPVAYLLACCPPAGPSVDVWAIPEPVMFESLSGLLLEEKEDKYTVQIKRDEQRIHKSTSSPDLTPYFRQFLLTAGELFVLKEARDADSLAKRNRAAREEDGDFDEEDTDSHTVAQAETAALLAAETRRLAETGFFDPEGVADARDRVLSSIVRRRGQPAFRQALLEAYNGQCATSGCAVEAVLDAAHIVRANAAKSLERPWCAGGGGHAGSSP